MTLKEKLFYLLELAIEYGINPRAFLWKKITGRSSATYYAYLSQLRRRKPFDLERLNSTHQSFASILKNAIGIWKSKWKGDWYLVIFDIPERERRYRDQLRLKLIQFGFGQLQKSILICPVNRLNLIRRIMHEDLIKPYLVCLRISKIYGFGKEELVSRCWRLGPTREKHEEFISRYEARVREFQSSAEGLSLKEKNVASRWLMLMIEDELSELLKRYPPLPRAFMRNRLPFDDLVKRYRTWQKRLS